MRKPLIVSLSFIILAATMLVYSNHFHNAFHFDDAHTIAANLSIRDIHNIPKFFTDGSTMSNLPANQDYRPGLTTLNAIDFWLSGKPLPDPFMFHVSIFISFIILGICFYILLLHLLNKSAETPLNKWIALITTAWFWLHPANAETVNYIIARGDSFSTMCLVLAFVMYIQWPRLRSFYLYLLPVIIGFFVKEPAIMFVPLLFFYKLFFEQELSLPEALKKPAQAFRSFVPLIIPFAIAAALFIFSRYMVPDTWVPGGYDRWRYLATQPMVIFHYFGNFILPFNLVVDTDWTLVPSYTDDKVIFGSLFVIALLVLAWLTSRSRSWRPLAFGILWFFIALLPTSSLFPFAEVLNDHRTFFPYLGLFIGVAVSVRNLLLANTNIVAKPAFRITLFTCVVACLSLYAYGTHQRNKVWHTEESLWKDATEKAPGNVRAWMNYGNTQMAKGNFVVAEQCFSRGLQISPNYSYLNINMGVLKAAQGDPAAAEPYMKKAIALDPKNPECYSYYANYLMQNDRAAEATAVIQAGLQISPAHEWLNQLAKQNEAIHVAPAIPVAKTSDRMAKAQAWADAHPSPENYLVLSLDYYNAGEYENSVSAAHQSLKLRPEYDLAYNNICAAYNQLKMWDKAIEAGTQGLKINPANANIKANLDVSYKGKGK